MEKATELEYLRWFHNNADFGPAHGDVMIYLQQDFVITTNKEVPKGYEYE